LALLFVFSGGLGAGLLAIAFRWKPKWTRDGVIFAISVATLIRGLVDSDPALIYAGIAITGSVPLIRGTVDKVKDSTS
jgi:hypothetical protein